MFRMLREVLKDSHQCDTSFLSSDPSEFNEQIGLPLLPSTNGPHRLLQYQLDIIGYRGKDLLIVKSNKIGITEAVLRDMVMKGVVGDCAGYQMMLGAQDKNLAIENMRRLQAIFRDCPLLSTMVKQRTRTGMTLKNGTTYFVMPRRAAAIRGWPRLKYAFQDEAAHYGLLDDSEFLSATTTRLANTDGYYRAVSTPLGQRGFFYQQYTAGRAGKIPLKVMELSYYVALGTLITQGFIDKEKSRLGPLFEQEYECCFISGRNAAIEPALLEEREDYKPERW